MKGLPVLLIVCIFSMPAFSQPAVTQPVYPEIGKPCPDFTLQDIEYYPKKQASLKDFRGKWLILDFWYATCGACIESFPKINALQHAFAGKVQFVQVGITSLNQDYDKQLRPIYEAFREREHLKLACAFDLLFCDRNHWEGFNCPHLVIIDDKGIVQGITNEIDSSDVQTFLAGGHPALPITSDEGKAQRIPFNSNELFLINGNGGASDSDFLFRSVLAKFNCLTQSQSTPRQIDLHAISSSYPKGRVQILGLSLSYLYFYAYFGTGNWSIGDTVLYGRYAHHLIVDVRDSSMFQYSYDHEGKNIFSYSLSVPPESGTTARMERKMQIDLDSYFGFKTSLELRKCPCWRLVALPGAQAKLKTKVGKTSFDGTIPRVRSVMKNVSMRRLIEIIAGPVDHYGDTPLVDETGIAPDFNIDISVDYIDFDALKKSLNNYGLDLVPGEKLMKTIVVRDAQ